MCTAFDLPSLDFLIELDVDLKIASGDIVYSELIDKAASTLKPLVVSTGAATLNHVDAAVDIIKKYHTNFGFAVYFRLQVTMN